MTGRIDCARLPAMPPINVRLTHSKRKAVRWNRMFGRSDESIESVMSNSDAVATMYVPNGGEPFHVVWVRPDMEGDEAWCDAVFAHEAVHIAQNYFRYLGETSPSEELEAYAVQFVTCHLSREHRKWLKKRQGKHGR